LLTYEKLTCELRKIVNQPLALLGGHYRSMKSGISRDSKAVEIS